MTGSGTSEDPYIIYDVDDLQAVDDDLTAYYELGGNIDASATSTWNEGKGFSPIALYYTFTGQLDGKGYTITDLFINRSIPATLFYENDGLVQNLGLVDCNFTGNVAASFCYTNNGTFSKCYSTGALVGTSYMGGFVQWNKGTIRNCYSRASVTGDGGNRIAGFVQFNDGIGVIDNCYSTGAVTNGAWEAGFCQFNDAGNITNCFWDTETSGQASSDGGTGKTTAEMKTESTFTDADWDFTTIWYINPTINDGYPAIGVVTRIKGNPNIDQRMFQHVERMGR